MFGFLVFKGTQTQVRSSEKFGQVRNLFPGCQQVSTVTITPTPTDSTITKHRVSKKPNGKIVLSGWLQW